MRTKDYAGPLGVLAAGVVGFSLLCSMSALAMGDLNNYENDKLKSVSVLDLAIANVGTSVALTEQAVTAFVATPTIVSTNTDSPKRTAAPLPTETFAVPSSATPLRPTSTRRYQAVDTARPISSRTRTPRPPDTSTPVPPTPVPPTHTPQPPTDTKSPPTHTSAPPPADTEPPPTDPPPTQESTEPPVTDVPIVIDVTAEALP